MLTPSVRRPTAWFASPGTWMTVAFFAASVALRLVWVDRIPGFSGDEALGPQEAREFLAGLGPLPIWTPTHRLLAPPWLLSLLISESASSPSLLTLRLMAVGGGLLAVAAAWWLLPRVMPRANARLVALLLATHPVLIAYSRVAWEIVWLPVAAVLVLYAILDGRARTLVPSFLFGFTIHTSILLLLPLAVFRHLYVRGGRASALRWSLAAGVAAGVGALIGSRWIPFLGLHYTAHDWGIGLRLIPQFFVGTSAYREFVGDTPAWFGIALDAGMALLLLAWLGAGVRRWRQPAPDASGLGTGFVLTLLAILLFLGPTPFWVSVGRFAVPLVPPFAAIFVEWLGHRMPRRRELVVRASAALALVTFSYGYFFPVSPPVIVGHRTGARVESKSEVVRLLGGACRDPAERPVVIADDWWSYWPLRYLTGDVAGARTFHADENLPTGIPVAGFVPRDADRFVAKLGRCGVLVSRVGEVLTPIVATIRRRDPRADEVVLRDNVGLPFLSVLFVGAGHRPPPPGTGG